VLASTAAGFWLSRRPCRDCSAPPLPVTPKNCPVSVSTFEWALHRAPLKLTSVVGDLAIANSRFWPISNPFRMFAPPEAVGTEEGVAEGIENLICSDEVTPLGAVEVARIVGCCT